MLRVSLKIFKRLEFDGYCVVLGNLGSLGYDTTVHIDDLTIVSDTTYKFGITTATLDSEPEDVYNHYQTYKRIRYAKERFKGNGKSFQEFIEELKGGRDESYIYIYIYIYKYQLPFMEKAVVSMPEGADIIRIDGVEGIL